MSQPYSTLLHHILLPQSALFYLHRIPPSNPRKITHPMPLSNALFSSNFFSYAFFSSHHFYHYHRPASLAYYPTNGSPNWSHSEISWWRPPAASHWTFTPRHRKIVWTKTNGWKRSPNGVCRIALRRITRITRVLYCTPRDIWRP